MLDIVEIATSTNPKGQRKEFQFSTALHSGLKEQLPSSALGNGIWSRKAIAVSASYGNKLAWQCGRFSVSTQGYTS